MTASSEVVHALRHIKPVFCLTFCAKNDLKVEQNEVSKDLVKEILNRKWKEICSGIIWIRQMN